MMIQQKRKSHFQLLEVMVAIFLILLCAIPALQVFVNIYKAQAEVIRTNQRDHLAYLIHAHLIEQLYKRVIPLEEILENKSETFTDPGIQEQLRRLSYEATYAFSVLEPKKLETQEKTSKYLVQLIITIQDKSQRNSFAKLDSQTHNPPSKTSYDYLLYVDRGAKDKKLMPQLNNPPPQSEATPGKDKPVPGRAAAQDLKHVAPGRLL